MSSGTAGFAELGRVVPLCVRVALHEPCATAWWTKFPPHMAEVNGTLQICSTSFRSKKVGGDDLASHAGNPAKTSPVEAT